MQDYRITKSRIENVRNSFPLETRNMSSRHVRLVADCVQTFDSLTRRQRQYMTSAMLNAVRRMADRPSRGRHRNSETESSMEKLQMN